MSLATLLAPVAELLRRSVVQVRVGAAGGAGVVWDAEGAVVTNAHVAQAARVTVVRPDGAAVSGEVERLDSRRDLALVRAAVACRFPTLGFERQRKVSATNFFQRVMQREGPAAWRKLGGTPTLSDLGLVQSARIGNVADDLFAGRRPERHRGRSVAVGRWPAG